jgi:hypothetical protein
MRGIIKKFTRFGSEACEAGSVNNNTTTTTTTTNNNNNNNNKY